MDISLRFFTNIIWVILLIEFMLDVRCINNCAENSTLQIRYLETLLPFLNNSKSYSRHCVSYLWRDAALHTHTHTHTQKMQNLSAKKLRLTRLQTMYNVLKCSKTWWENDDISIYRYRTGTGNKLNLIMRMTVATFSRTLWTSWDGFIGSAVLRELFADRKQLHKICSHSVLERAKLCENGERFVNCLRTCEWLWSKLNGDDK